MRRLLFILLVGAMYLHAGPPSKARRIAVLEFDNVTKDKTLDWIGTGIKEHLTTQLSQIPEFIVVERTRLGAVTKELNFNRSQLVDPATAQKMGKILGVQSVVVGSYLKLDDAMRINVRVVEVETGEIKAPTLVDGSFKKFFDLENDVAKKLVAEMKGGLADADRKQLETTPTNNLDAVHQLADGVYFLRQNILDDAITQFDLALKTDPNYGEAWYYKGVALQKKKQWDEAAAAFKKALPRSQGARNVKWSWQPSFQQEKSERGRMMLYDQQRIMDAGRMLPPNRLLYGEKVGNQTALQLSSVDRKTTETFTLDDPQVVLQQPGLSHGPHVLLQSFPFPPVKELTEATIIVLDTNTRRNWRRPMSVKGGTFVALLFDEILAFYYPSGRWIAVDPATGADRWQRENLQLSVATITYKVTKKYGAVFVGMSPTGKLCVIRADTGADAWSADLPGKKSLLEVRDGVVAALDPEGRVSAFDLESGQPQSLPVLELGSVRVDSGMIGNVQYVPSLLRDRVLYVWTKDKSFVAVDLKPGTKSDARVLWRQPVENAPRSVEWDGQGVFLSTEAGEVLLFDAASGKPRGSVKLSEKIVSIHEVANGMVLASSADAVYLVDAASGKKKWEYADRFPGKDPRLFKSAVAFRTGAREIACLDAETGGLLWQHSGNGAPTLYITDSALFVADEDGLKEYGAERQAVAGIADKEVYTELARTLLLKGEAKEAQVYTKKVLGEIDSNYGPARLVQASALKTQGDLPGAGRELSAFLVLEAPESQKAKEVLEDLKKDHGLLWHADSEAPAGLSLEMRGKIVSVQGSADGELRLYAFDRANGQVSWRHPGQRLMQLAPDFEQGRIFYLTGRRESPQILDIFAVNLGNGERRKVATLNSPRDVNRSRFYYSAGRLYVGAAHLDFQTQKITLQVLAVQADNGKVLWEKAHETSFLRPPGLWYARGDRFFYSVDQELLVVNGADGAVLAHQAEPSSVAPNGRTWEQQGPKDMLYYADGDQKIVAFDTAKNAVASRGKVAGLTFTSFISTDLVHDQVLYDFDDRRVFAARLDGTSGELPLLWKFEVGSGQMIRQLVFSDGRLFARRSDNVLLELDLGSGKVVKEYPLLWDSGFTMISQNTAYVMSNTGRAYAMRLAAGKP